MNKEPNGNVVKLLAVVLMTVDHLSAIAGRWELLRVVGRLAFPLFVCLLAYNYVHKSQDRRRFLVRLLVWSLVAQVPYMVAIGGMGGNVLLTFALGIAVDRKWCSDPQRMWAVGGVLCLMHFVESWRGLMLWDYGAMGVLAVVLAIKAVELGNAWLWLLVAEAVFLANFRGVGFTPIVLGSAAASGVGVFVMSGWIKWDASRFVAWRAGWYAYYPAHLMILKLVVIGVGLHASGNHGPSGREKGMAGEGRSGSVVERPRSDHRLHAFVPRVSTGVRDGAAGGNKGCPCGRTGTVHRDQQERLHGRVLPADVPRVSSRRAGQGSGLE